MVNKASVVNTVCLHKHVSVVQKILWFVYRVKSQKGFVRYPGVISKHRRSFLFL